MSGLAARRLGALALGFLIGSWPGAAAAQNAEIALRSGVRTFSPSTSQDFAEQVAAAPTGRHGLVSFRHLLTPLDRRRLTAAGVTILNRLTPTVYRIHAARTAALADTAVTARARFFVPLRPEDRVDPPIWRAEFRRFASRSPFGPTGSNYVLDPDSALRLVVRFESDVSLAQTRTLFQSLAITASPTRAGSWRAIMSRGALIALAANDLVRWIEAGPAPASSDMESVRAALGVAGVQTFDVGTGAVTGLSGQGVQVGVFDTTGFHGGHPDFTLGGGTGSRVLANVATVGSHSTFVAGVIAGNGYQSALVDNWGVANGGTPHQWHGIAPLADLLGAQWLRDPGAVNTVTLRDHIATHKLDLSNHSYWITTDGEYGDINRLHDGLIRGDDGGDGSPIPARLHVHSAGNFAKQPLSGNQRGFFSLGSQLKNALLVGNYFVAADRIATSSSLGPTHDGRIKPDVVAPGTYVTSAGYCVKNADTSDDAVLDPPYYPAPGSPETQPCRNSPTGVRSGFYWVQTGTSVASGAVTGVLALVLQELVAAGTDLDLTPPFPSLLRGIAIHSARDLKSDLPWFVTTDGTTGSLPVQAFEGPDFVSGFGLADAAVAVDVVRTGAYRQDVIDATCQVRSYTMKLSAGPLDPVKLTLAWDDPASDVPELSLTQPRLINDLDLVVIDPLGAKHYPWLLDQQITDDTGAPLADDAQTCGTPVTVVRRLNPTPDPYYAGADGTGADLPGSVDDPIAPADLQPAGRGKDHLNNVEQVVTAGIPGTWTIQVSGFLVDQAPQPFALVGLLPGNLVPFLPFKFCQRFPFICEMRFLALCVRYPILCKRPHFIPIRPGVLALSFRDRLDVNVIELAALCAALDVPLPCGGSRAATGPTTVLELGPFPVPLRPTLFDERGRVVPGDLTAGRWRWRLPAGPDALFLFISPEREIRPGASYPVPVGFSRVP